MEWEITQDPVVLRLNIRPQKCSQFRRQPISKSVIIGDVPIAIREREGKREQQPCRSWAMPTAKLDEIVRQRNSALKSAVELLAKGQVSAALESLRQQGHVKEIPDTQERIRAIAKSYVESPEKTLIVSPDHASRRELNVAVLEELKANGTLASEDHSFRVLVQHQDMTGAERSWASPGQTHLERQALDLVREMLFRGESRWKNRARWDGLGRRISTCKKCHFLL